MRVLTTFGYQGEDETERDTSYVRRHFITPQEDAYTGGSPDVAHIRKPSDAHIPYGVLSGEITIEFARMVRREREYFVIGHHPFEFPGQLVLTLEDLDPVTGETVRDPQAIGEFDEEGQKIITYPNRDLNQEFRNMLKDRSPITDGRRELFTLIREGQVPPRGKETP